MKKRNQLLALCALVILVLTVFACENPFIPGKYKEPAPPQAPSISVEVTPIGPYVKGEGVTITAKASVSDRGDLSYQWYSNTKNSSSGGNKISGATGESYRPSTDVSSENILEPSISYYYVQVTNTLNGKTTSATSRIIDVAVFDIPIGTNPIRELGLNVTAPVKDGVPASTVTTSGSGYSVQSVTWNPPHNTFMSGGKYTIWVMLQADAGCTFIALRTATMNGQAAAVENNNGSTLYLSYEFPSVDLRVVTGIAIKTQPNELTYDHEDTLRLQGLEVTLSYDSGDPEDVTFANFAARTVTTNLTHGITLSHTTHNNTPIAVSCNGYTVNTNNLTVNKAQITAAFIGIDSPAKDNIPVTVATVASSDGFTAGTVSWSPSHNPFQGNINYTATVTLTAKADYEFAGGMTAHINSSPVTSPNGSITSNPNGTRTLSFEFDKTFSGTVLSIAVTHQPNNLTYTHGDTLDLTGLVVTVYLENSDPEVLTFSNSSIFQTVPANGFVLRHAAYDGQPITVNYSGHNAATNPLTVNKKALTLNTSAASHTKVYDGNTTANNIGGLTLAGIVGNENVYIEQVNGVYTSADAGTKTVNITTVVLDGSASGNYTLALPMNNVTLTGAGNVGITKANPTVTTWPTASVINYGQALSASTLTPTSGNGTGVNGATVSGTFAWTNPSTVPSNAGVSNYSVTFTPTSGNYNTTTNNVSITVNPQVTFVRNNESADTTQFVTYNTALSRPTDPTRTNYTFNGWYSDSGLTNFYNFYANVTSNITLYAKWILTSDINTVTNVTNSAAGMAMVFVGGGAFSMGSTRANSRTQPVHDVTLKSFYIGKYEVTQEQYQAVMNKNPSYFQGSSYLPETGEVQTKRPVESVTWYDAVEFCNTLSTQKGLTPVYTLNNVTRTSSSSGGSGSVSKITNADVTANWNANGYRLPTEAEWEYAARDKGTVTTYGSTNEWVGNLYRTHEVGKKPASNALGMYDVLGNVTEWCWDIYGAYTATAQTNPTGATSGTSRTWRGGAFDCYRISWDYENNYMRYSVDPKTFGFSSGFRVVRNAN